ncbi:hypothetical protein [Mesorhizobium qingshengii]|uniref:Uncharacterized protein n=1 Tax=Mesorhizobium qingshengii TaxID=1165689 RepID=A0A1G5V0Z6_9HYPH|nr:hypothetical protein [Mesorhizobium qingshengii]SDA39504.1 hypothetical protein SAMN02927914_00153 [Mesorhizobium qingshengii]
MNLAENRAVPDAVESKTTKGFHMRRAFLDLAKDVASFFAMAAFLAFAYCGTAALSAATIAARIGQ